jgi:hypothetical protein
MRNLPLVYALCGFASLYGVARGEVESGPRPESKIEVLKVFAVTGDSAGKDIDFAAERKDKPTIFIFVQAEKWDRPMARYLRALDEGLAASTDGAHLVAIWLTKDVDKAKEYLPKAQESLKLSHAALTVYLGDTRGPDGWAINTDAHCTAVVVRGQKVVASIGYRSVNETDARFVLRKLAP